jgi:hypothetical protein
MFTSSIALRLIYLFALAQGASAYAAEPWLTEEEAFRVTPFSSESCAAAVQHFAKLHGDSLFNGPDGAGLSPDQFSALLQQRGEENWLRVQVERDGYLSLRAFFIEIYVERHSEKPEEVKSALIKLATAESDLSPSPRPQQKPNDALAKPSKREIKEFFPYLSNSESLLTEVYGPLRDGTNLSMLGEIKNILSLRLLISQYRLALFRGLRKEIPFPTSLLSASRAQTLKGVEYAGLDLLDYSVNPSNRNTRLVVVQSGELITPMTEEESVAAKKSFRQCWARKELLPRYFREQMVSDLGYLNFLAERNIEPEKVMGEYYQALARLFIRE